VSTATIQTDHVIWLQQLPSSQRQQVNLLANTLRTPNNSTQLKLLSLGVHIPKSVHTEAGIRMGKIREQKENHVSGVY
jgi:hypothetical protein